MTNGEKLKEIFPSIEIVAIVPNEIVVTKKLDDTATYSNISFRYEWWNAKYKEPTTKNEVKYCDRNICLKNEYNNIGCEDCEVTKSQEPMVEIDLYSVIKQKYIEREVLDKIRAELHATAEMHEDGNYYIRDEWIDEYFDKYKAETEDT